MTKFERFMIKLVAILCPLGGIACIVMAFIAHDMFVAPILYVLGILLLMATGHFIYLVKYFS